jgi:membrane protein DedA with SNARE-associated domain
VPAATASALWYAFLAYAGYALAANWAAVKTLVSDANRALGILAVVVALALAAWLWRRARRHAGRAAPSD